MHNQLKSTPLIKGQDYTKKEIDEARKNNKILTISPCTNGSCNFKCFFCYTDKKMKKFIKNKQLTFSEYKDILVQAKDLGAKTMRLAGWGEPFMDPIFYNAQDKSFPLIEFANSIGLYAMFFTNGSFITHEIAKRLYDLDVSVVAKKNTFSRDIQNKFSGNKKAFELMNRGLNALIDVGLNNFNPPRLAVESMLTKMNIMDIEVLFRWLRKRNIIPSFQLIMHGGKGEDETYHLSKMEAKDVFYRLLEIDENEFGYTWIPTPPYVGYTCDKLYYNMVVDPYGNVQPCYAIDIYAGNTREKSLYEMLNSELFRKTRQIEKYIAEPCKSCEIEGCYYGCRCDTFNCGDLYGSYTKCWH